MTGPIIRPGSVAVNIITGASEQDFIGISSGTSGSLDADGTLTVGATTVEMATDADVAAAVAGSQVVFLGDWDADTAYATGVVVQDGRNLYQANAASTGTLPTVLPSGIAGGPDSGEGFAPDLAALWTPSIDITVASMRVASLNPAPDVVLGLSTTKTASPSGWLASTTATVNGTNGAYGAWYDLDVPVALTSGVPVWVLSHSADGSFGYAQAGSSGQHHGTFDGNQYYGPTYSSVVAGYYPCIQMRGTGASFADGPWDVAYQGTSPVEVVSNVAAGGAAQTIADPALGTTITSITLTAPCTLTFPTAGAGKSFTLQLIQDATGSRHVTWPTVTWPAATAPTLTTGAGKKDVFSFLCIDDTTWLGFTTALNL